MSLVRIWAVVSAFVLVMATRSILVGIPPRDPGGQYFVTRVALTAGLCAAYAVLEAVLRTPRGSRSPGAVWSTLRGLWPRPRLTIAALALLAYHVTYLTYHNLKSWDVLLAPRDRDLTAVDVWIFGRPPAVLLHDLLGEHVAAHVLLAIYETFPTLVVLSVPLWVFLPRLVDGVTALAGLIWVWILGTASYYAVPSLGPFDDRPQDFAGLPVTHATRTQALYLAQRDHLLAHPGAHDAFAQVSAFASLHVAVTTVITLSAARLGMRRTARVLTVFLALTIVATIYLGWHFAVDDVAGLAIGWLAVRLGILTVSWRLRAPAAPKPWTADRRP